MGQAWCKEKSNKAQDSKSPLDRVFLRCAHRIYPGLKEEGSVLGGATQRVTSSEIGYACSPPREVLTRGQSIDSVDRPFHPSDWVDVNLEVPVTPRTSTAMTSPTLDTSIYPPSSLVALTNFSGSSLREFAPVPPPRRKKKNRGRPLPPKPDDVARCHVVDRAAIGCTKNSWHTSQEPLYSSVKLPRNWSNDKEIFEHKINGTGRIIPSTVVASSRSSRDNSSRDDARIASIKDSRRKNSSTVSLPNYSELEVTNEFSSCDEDEDEPRIHKITAAGSLPVLITSGALENLKKSDNWKRANAAVGRNEGNEKKAEPDEVDFSFEQTINREHRNSITKFEPPRLTSTPMRNGLENESPTTVGGWFLHQARSPGSEANSLIDVSPRRETEKPEAKTRTRPRRSSSSESEHSEPTTAKEDHVAQIDQARILRSNIRVELLPRTISEESLPREMLENDPTEDFFDDVSLPIDRAAKNIIPEDEFKSEKIATIVDESKTPPPSPEPKIKPEILDNDHTTLLKVLRDDRTDESNPSSMTPSLNELEAALSDMLEQRMDEDTALERDVGKKNSGEILEKPAQPKIISLTNILGIEDDSGAVADGQTKFSEEASFLDIPPEKPCRLGHTSQDEGAKDLSDAPTPPRRRNRYSGYVPSILERGSLERSATPEDPYPNDRLI